MSLSFVHPFFHSFFHASIYSEIFAEHLLCASPVLAAGDTAGNEPHTIPPFLEHTVWQENENLNGDYKCGRHGRNGRNGKCDWGLLPLYNRD